MYWTNYIYQLVLMNVNEKMFTFIFALFSQDFGKVSLSLTGEANVPIYFQISSTGQITTKTDLKTDSALMYKVIKLYFSSLVSIKND